jgi:hypothetical protein
MREFKAERRRRRWRALKAFVFGLVAGCATLFVIAWLSALPPR